MDPTSTVISGLFHMGNFMSFFTVLVTSKIAAGVLAGGTLAAGGTAAAAYTGTLPAPLQQTAHDFIGAPAAAQDSKAPQDSKAAQNSKAEDHKPDADSHGKASKPADAPESRPNATPVGPDASGPAAFGLCKAFTNGGLDSSSTAYKSLATAAGNDDIATYCKSVPVPGQSAEHRKETSGKSAADRKSAPHPPAKAERGQSHKPATAGKP
ncbi:protein tyrosine phosphatase [Arthrobacter sp. ISL-30]|uniref:protein tyrosine phosphatase n=1 Tax=Arthrobacter sp. ISL-30 TaxID=2819109 RepID=UPI001BE6762A|nr:protein tyrosine phosphatase [Arthrobacter sp. ISL-30]MBT2514363.1 protein tyrosine phosphatase [Arthrobacter sp. ISL-30]